MLLGESHMENVGQTDLAFSTHLRLIDVIEVDATHLASSGLAGASAATSRRDVLQAMLETYLPVVYRFALRVLRDEHVAEDVAQECMLRAWRHRKKLRDPNVGRVWLLRITANLCRDHGRRKQRRGGTTVSLDCEPSSLKPHVDATLQKREELERVMTEIDNLSPKRRQVLYLHAIEQLSHDEIATVLSMTNGSVRSTLAQARRALRERLAELDQG